MSSSIVDEEKFTFVWKIKNLYSSVLKTSECIFSPTFKLPNSQATHWRLKLCCITSKISSDIHYTDYSSCFLERVDDEGPEHIDVKCVIFTSPGAEHLFSLSHCFLRKEILGVREFISNSEIEATNTLTIICELHFLDPIFTDLTQNSEVFLPLIFKEESEQQSPTAKDFMQKIATQVYKTKKNLLAIPRKCIAQSWMPFERAVIDWPVEDAFINGTENKQVITVSLSKHFFVIMITLNDATAHNDTVKITIRNINSVFESYLFVSCQVKVLLNGSEYINLPEEKTLYFKKDDEWSLKKSIKHSELKSKERESLMNCLSWNFEFKFFKNEMKSEIIWEECCYAQTDVSLPDLSILSNQLRILHTDKDLCDVALEVDEVSFPAHKVVLSALSPVFADMFRTDKAQSTDSTVTIKDFDEDDVGKLVYYIYSGTVKDLDYVKILRLFALADRYQVLPLMNLCRNFLITNLNDENICGALFLADKLNEDKLCKAAVQFLSYSSDILNSDQWAILEKENMAFALKVVKEVIFLKK